MSPRPEMISWARSTCEQGISSLSSYLAAEITEAKSGLEDQDSTYKKMNGIFVCGLKGNKISSDLPGVDMTDVFSVLLKTETCPLYPIVDYVKKMHVIKILHCELFNVI